MSEIICIRPAFILLFFMPTQCISHLTVFIPPNTLAAHISLNICKLKQSLSKAEPKYSFNDQQHVATGFAVIQNPKEIRT